jgi:L-ascorbate metabolism protein UlaG (beta-lactamase superfamily)
MRDRSLYRITYVGHATVLIEVGGARILTDPVLRYRIVHLRRRRSPLLTAWQEQIDAVLISHLHYDHLDLPSLRQVGLATRLLVPLGAGTLLRQHGFTNVEELRAGERTVVGGVPVSAVTANHNGTRGPLGPTAECLGFVVGSGQQRTYFAGDTDLFPAMHQLEGQVDVGLLPVWGWGPTLGPGHLDPYGAAQACQRIKPQVAVPIHWGTLYPMALHRLTRTFLIDPPLLFREFMLRMAPQTDVRILQPGEHFELVRGSSEESGRRQERAHLAQPLQR